MHSDLLITNMSFKFHENTSLSNYAKNKDGLHRAIFLVFGLTVRPIMVCASLK